MILQYLKEFKKVTKSQFRKLLIDKLPDSLNADQKEKLEIFLHRCARKGLSRS